MAKDIYSSGVLAVMFFVLPMFITWPITIKICNYLEENCSLDSKGHWISLITFLGTIIIPAVFGGSIGCAILVLTK